MKTEVPSIYDRLGVRPIINGVGASTKLGGSIPPPAVARAIEEASSRYVVMSELLEQSAGSGRYIANLLGVEAAYVTSGAAAGLTLSAAACIAGTDQDNIKSLPNTAGMKNEFVIQKRHRYAFDPLYTVSGGELVEVGDSDGCTSEQLDGAIGPRTAAVVYQVRPSWGDALVSLRDAVDIAHRRGVPVIADAASQVLPPRLHARQRPCGRPGLLWRQIHSVRDRYRIHLRQGRLHRGGQGQRLHSLRTGPAGSHGLGRGMKVAHGAMVGMAVALEEWLAADHGEIARRYEKRLNTIQEALADVGGVRTEIVRYEHFVHVYLFVRLDYQTLGMTSEQIAAQLDSGTPRVKVLTSGHDALQIGPDGLNDGEEHIVAHRLRGVFTGTNGA